MFPLSGRIKLSVTGVSENGRKNIVSTSHKKVSASMNLSKNGWKKSGKNLQIKQCCFKQTKNWFPLAGVKNVFKKTFLLDEKTAYIGRNIWKIK